MASDPLVCAILLTRDRPEMAARAVRCFREQTYANKELLVYASHPPFYTDALGLDSRKREGAIRDASDAGWKTIGSLRNAAIHHEGPIADIIVHWDDDDYSHPNRIAEQVALLQSSGAECVGYNEVLFWRIDQDPRHDKIYKRNDEAWIYRNPNPAYAVGASLCYWRTAWERQPFKDLHVGEDRDFIIRVKTFGEAGFSGYTTGTAALGVLPETCEPSLIQSLHGGNTWNSGEIERSIAHGSQEWRRAPEFDRYCRERMAL